MNKLSKCMDLAKYANINGDFLRHREPLSNVCIRLNLHHPLEN